MPVKALIARAIDRLSEGAQFLCLGGTEVGERVWRNPLLGCQFIQAGEGRTCRHEMRLRVFLFQGTVPLETEQPDERHQAQSLSDQRDQNDTKGEEDDEIALREEYAAAKRERQGYRRCKRGTSAHAHPGDHRNRAPSWLRVAVAQAR